MLGCWDEWIYGERDDGDMGDMGDGKEDSCVGRMPDEQSVARRYA